MRKGILFGLCLIIATLCIAYGIIVKAAGSGTGFYIIWFAIAAVLVGLGVIIHWQLWSRIPFGVRIAVVVLCGIFLLSFVIIEGCVVRHMHDKGEDRLDYIIVLGAQVRQNGPSIVLQYRLDEAVKYLNDNDVCVFGGCSLDKMYYQKTDGKYGENPDLLVYGGKGSNQAIAAARAGAKTTIISRRGKDAEGLKILDNLK